MFEVKIYKDSGGNEPIADYLRDLASKANKDNRIKLNKILDYINVLTQYGTTAGEPYVKHIDGTIWELRPLRDRIFFFCWQGDTFVLLHHFMKKTQKTPQREIDQAKRNMNDFIERSKDDEK